MGCFENWKLVLVAVMFFPATGMAQRDASRPHAAKLVCDEPVYKFGEADHNDPIDHTFVLRNEGDISLLIDQVYAPCGCTVVDLERTEILPGEEAALKARLSLRGLRGPVRRHLVLYSNDPRQPRFRLWFEGTALRDDPPDEQTARVQREERALWIAPDHILLSGEGPATSRNLIVYPGRAGSFRLTEVETPLPDIEVTVSPFGEQGYRIRIANLPQDGSLKGLAVRLYTDLEALPVLDVPIRQISPHDPVAP